jgi:hypothetical protein
MNFRGVMLYTLVKCALVKGFDFFSERELKLILEAALVCLYMHTCKTPTPPRSTAVKLVMGAIDAKMGPDIVPIVSRAAGVSGPDQQVTKCTAS